MPSAPPQTGLYLYDKNSKRSVDFHWKLGNCIPAPILLPEILTPGQGHVSVDRVVKLNIDSGHHGPVHCRKLQCELVFVGAASACASTNVSRSSRSIVSVTQPPALSTLYKILKQKSLSCPIKASSCQSMCAKTKTRKGKKKRKTGYLKLSQCFCSGFQFHLFIWLTLQRKLDRRFLMLVKNSEDWLTTDSLCLYKRRKKKENKSHKYQQLNVDINRQQSCFASRPKDKSSTETAPRENS